MKAIITIPKLMIDIINSYQVPTVSDHEKKKQLFMDIVRKVFSNPEK